MRFRLLLILLGLSVSLQAQYDLSGSRRSSVYMHIYKLHPQEALALYQADLKAIEEKYLHTLTDSFLTDDNEPPALQPGNYLFVKVVENRLVGELRTISPLRLKVINNNRDLIIALHDQQGKLITDATVFIGNKKIPFHPGSKTFLLEKQQRSGLLKVYHREVLHLYTVEPEEDEQYEHNSFWTKLVRAFSFLKKKKPGYAYDGYFDGKTVYEKNFTGFMVFSKPKYKPRDTVKLKAWIVDNAGRGINRPLLLRITDNGFRTDSVVAVVQPYRAGGYEYSFVVKEGFDLRLDQEVMISLEEESSRMYDLKNFTGTGSQENTWVQQRKILMRGKFRYEEYNLSAVTFKARTDQQKHQPGNPVSIYCKAVDENDLPVMDGRVHILVKPVHGIRKFHRSPLFLPDTLWSHTQLLENIGETKITIPDSVFPAVTTPYEITCTFLNSNNEQHSVTLQQKYDHVKEMINIARQGDSLQIHLMREGRSVAANASIVAYNDNDDTVQEWSLTLPAAIAVHPFAKYYEVDTDNAFEEWEPKFANNLVTCISYRTRDSVLLKVINPLKLPFWYTLTEGTKVIRRGYGDSLWIEAQARTTKPGCLYVQYIYADEVYQEAFTIPFREKLLNVAVDQPEAIYPGQQASIGITVTDVNGQPVADADLTAWAVTTKMKQPLPPVPYYGKHYWKPDLQPELEVEYEDVIKNALPLNWERWSRAMHLDSIEYFKFLHPREIYSNTEDVPDSITQIAPFVVKNGELQPVHQVYIDEVPVFFSQAQHLQQYSIQTSPGKHYLRIRTPDHLISIDSIWVTPNKKTIICINADSSNKRIALQKRPDTLNAYETTLWSKYLLLVENNFGQQLAQVRQNDDLFVLNFNGKLPVRNRTTLIGPMKDGLAWLEVKNQFSRSFEPEGGYSFLFNPGLIKQKQWQGFPFQTKLSRTVPPNNFRDHVLSAREIDSLWHEYLDHRNITESLFRNPGFSVKESGRLLIDVSDSPQNKSIVIKNKFLFRYDQPDFIRVYQGNSNDLGYLPPGYYRVCLLLKNNDYFLIDSLLVRKNGVNYYATGPVIPKAKDRFSLRIAAILNNYETTSSYTAQATDLDSLNRIFNMAHLDQASFTRKIEGRVTSDLAEPLQGVTVMVKGTNAGTVTNENGYYSLSAPENGTLIASYIGFSTAEKKIGPGDHYDFVLYPLNQHLDEVVVVGYGVQRKKELVGSVTSIHAETTLQGQVAGITIRGISSHQALKQQQPQQLLMENNLPDIPELPAANTLRKNFRDDAYWQPGLRTGIDGKTSFTTIFPDDITNWRTYTIAMGSNKTSGDHIGNIRSFKPISAALALPAFIVTGDSMQVIGKMMNYTNDSVTVQRRFEVDGQLQQEGTAGLRNSIIDTFLVTGSTHDSLTLKYTLRKTDGYFDGEERTIPVFRQGVLEAKGSFGALTGDTSMIFSPDPNGGKVSLFAEASVLPVLLDEIERIHRYEYLCNEQMASKLKALILKKRIYHFLHKPFKEDKYIRYLVGKLNQSKVQGVLWGWWPGNNPSLWVSQHVLEALLMAEKEGFFIALDKSVIIDQLAYRLEQQPGKDQINELRLLQLLQARVDYKKYIDTLEKREHGMSLYEKLLVLQLKQQAGIAVSLDTLIKMQQRTLFGNTYWGEENYRFFDNAIQHTVLMYRVLQKAGGYDPLLRSTRQYFLEKRKDGYWRNTYESSLILEAILPDLLSENAIQERVTLVIEGQVDTIRSFPYTAALSPQKTIRLHKKGGLPLYVGVYQQGWNVTPQKVAGAFVVNSSFQSHGGTIATLKAGEPVVMTIQVNVTADAEYVMIEAPIPAGCSYKDKEQSYYYGPEVYREYFKNKVSIFCASLPKGDYTFKVSLLPRFTGVYHVNPAKAGLMYFPVFYGREGMKKISIR